MVRDRRRSARRRAGGLTLTRVLVVTGVALLVAALVAGVASQTGPAGASYRRALDRSFVLLVGPPGTRSQATGTAVAALFSGGPTGDRTTFLASLDTLVSDTEAQWQAAVSPPPQEPPGGGACLQALQERALAPAGIRSALLGLLGGPDGSRATSEPAAAGALDQAAAQVARSDSDWGACRQALQRDAGHAALPPSRWITDPTGWSAPAVAGLVSAVAGDSALAARHDLVVLPGAVGLVPAVVSTSNGAAVLPPTSTLQVRLVVANHGNVDEHGVTVTVAVTGTGGVAPVTVTVNVPAGGSVAVDPPALKVPPNLSGTVTVSVAGPAGPGTGTSIPVVVAPGLPPTTTTTTPPHPTTTRAHGTATGPG